MAEIKFLDLTADNAFDFCAVLDSIGVENIVNAIPRDDITAFQKAKKNNKAIGIMIALKVSAVLVKHIATAREPIYTFFAGCCEWDNGSPVSVDELRKLKLSAFLKLFKDFFKKDDLADFFTEVAELLPTDDSALKNS